MVIALKVYAIAFQWILEQIALSLLVPMANIITLIQKLVVQAVLLEHIKILSLKLVNSVNHLVINVQLLQQIA